MIVVILFVAGQNNIHSYIQVECGVCLAAFIELNNILFYVYQVYPPSLEKKKRKLVLSIY